MTETLTRDQRFAQIVLAAFKAAGRHTDDRVKAAGGPSSTWMTGCRKAADGLEPLRNVRGDTFDSIDQAAGWPTDTARKVYEGAEPPGRSVSLDNAQVTHFTGSGKTERLLASVSDGELIFELLARLQERQLDGEAVPDELATMRNRLAHGMSEAGVRLKPAALDAEESVDEPPGGSDHDEG